MKNTTKINTKEQIDNMSKNEIKASIFNISKELIDYAFNRVSQLTTARVSIRSESCQTANNYHFNMNSFIKHIIAHINDNEYKAFLISENVVKDKHDNSYKEIVVSDSFKAFLIAKINALLN